MVTKGVHVAFLMGIGFLANWPDWAAADRMSTGLNITGDIESTPLNTTEDLFGDEADEWNAKLSSNGPCPEVDDTIFEKTEKQRDKKKVLGYFTKYEIDKRFGRGR